MQTQGVIWDICFSVDCYGYLCGNITLIVTIH